MVAIVTFFGPFHLKEKQVLCHLVYFLFYFLDYIFLLIFGCLPLMSLAQVFASCNHSGADRAAADAHLDRADGLPS